MAIQESLEQEKQVRKAERAGRIRAEQELRRLQLQMQVVAGSSNAGQSGHQLYPFKPIGCIESCFSQRNGTPRQPLLVAAARSRLQLAPDVPFTCLEGLDQYSHCWVLYIFHANTDLAKAFQGNRAGLKGKIRVPRLNGERMGVLATRSPHRPVPIGLSVAKVVAVEGSCVILGGADIVNGSPVLDIKPYIPFCDAILDATAPSWVQAEAEDEPLQVAAVHVAEGVAEAFAACWVQSKQRSLYPTSEAFLELVKQVLSRDIRSVHQRLHCTATSSSVAGQQQQQQQPHQTQAAVSATEISQSSQQAAALMQEETVGAYHVVLEGIDVSYDIDKAGVVYVRSATLTDSLHQCEVNEERDLE